MWENGENGKIYAKLFFASFVFISREKRGKRKCPENSRLGAKNTPLKDLPNMGEIAPRYLGKSLKNKLTTFPEGKRLKKINYSTILSCLIPRGSGVSTPPSSSCAAKKYFEICCAQRAQKAQIMREIALCALFSFDLGTTTTTNDASWCGKGWGERRRRRRKEEDPTVLFASIAALDIEEKDWLKVTNTCKIQHHSEATQVWKRKNHLFLFFSKI